MTAAHTGALNAEILRNLGTLAANESMLNRVAKYLRKLVKEIQSDPTLMAKEEFFAKIERAEQQASRGKGMRKLPGEDLATFLKRNGYGI